MINIGTAKPVLLAKEEIKQISDATERCALKPGRSPEEKRARAEALDKEVIKIVGVRRARIINSGNSRWIEIAV